MIDVFGNKIEEKETIEDEPIKKIGLFDIFNDIGYEKKHCFDETVFNSFLAIKAFSQHIDTILYANELNKRSITDKQFVHDFLFYSIKPKKRYGKWAKQEKDEEIISYIKQKYSVNATTAKYYLKLMTEEDKQQIIQSFYIGGSK